MFFLLLLAFSEHLVFYVSYLISAFAVVVLLGFYLCYVLHSVRRGIVFSSVLAGLYGLLLSEDNALVLGSVMLFITLATIMVITRRINWYTIGSSWNTAVKSAQ